MLAALERRNEEDLSRIVIVIDDGCFENTIIKSNDKVKELFEKLEVYYLANKSENIYFTLLRRL